MNINELIKALQSENLIKANDNPNININYISYDSRDIKENTLFICKGLNFKEKYLQDSIKKGVTIYVSEKKYNVNIPCIIVTDIRKSLAVISKTFYPDNIFKIGITGTKGKTTTNYFLHNILTEYLKYKPGIFATHYYYNGKEEGKSNLTTPESLDLHKHLNIMTKENLKYVTMEVSSQATKHQRVYGMTFDIGIFLNIGEDHISEIEHPTFTDYLNCKLEFIKQCQTVILNKDMEKFTEVYETVKNKQVITFGQKDADYIISDINHNNNLSFKLNNESYEINIEGRFNIINASAAIIVAKLLNIDNSSIQKGLQKTKIPGRMNILKDGICPVIIDYAHNGLSAKSIYETLKEDYPGKNIKVVFGCTGDKGQTRRFEMGDLAGKYADYIYLTEDDPGHQKVSDICADIIEKIKPYNKTYEVIENRKEAITKAITNATPNDVIAILGKGDEPFIIVGDDYIPYETDFTIVQNLINNRKDN